jgi:DNA replication and repair protein RecF
MKSRHHIGRYAAVMIAPDDIEMINEGSELRRKFMDGILSQCNKAYLEHLLQYQKVLVQRNAWLKLYNSGGRADNTSLEYYNQLLSVSGNYLFTERKKFLSDFQPLLHRYYTLLSGGSERPEIRYQSDLFQQSAERLLEDHLQQDIRYQRTLRGVHKDDLTFLLDELSVKSYASQGQKKSFLFSLKLAQAEYIRMHLHQSPILLLDDIFEKLDQQRMQALLSIIRSPVFRQVLLTDTHEQRISETFGKDHPLGFIRLP